MVFFLFFFVVHVSIVVPSRRHSTILFGAIDSVPTVEVPSIWNHNFKYSDDSVNYNTLCHYVCG